MYLVLLFQAAQPFVRALHGWSVEELRCYVTWAKAANTNLHMTSEAEQVILAYYQQQRRAEERSQARTTIRMLESLVRVSQVLPAKPGTLLYMVSHPTSHLQHTPGMLCASLINVTGVFAYSVAATAF